MSTIIISTTLSRIACGCELYGAHALGITASGDPGVYMLPSGCLEGFPKAVGTDSLTSFEGDELCLRCALAHGEV